MRRMRRLRTNRATAAAWLWACAAACLCAGGCSKPAPRPAGGPARVVSFSPAITQMLFDMGLGDQVVGVTQFCRLPAGVKRPRLGDALSISAEAVLAVRPDVILAQTSPDQFQGGRDIDPHVHVVEIKLERLADISKAMEQVGKLAGWAVVGKLKAAEFREAMQVVADHASLRRQCAMQVATGPAATQPVRPRVLFVMGTDRPTVAGASNFVADLIELAGGVNAGADIPGQTRWRPTQIEAIIKAAPDVIICQIDSARAAEADKAKQYWLKWRDIPAARSGRVFVVTDPGWSIPSTHLVKLAAELGRIVHPGAAATQTAGEGGSIFGFRPPIAGLRSPVSLSHPRVPCFRLRKHALPAYVAGTCFPKAGRMAPGGGPRGHCHLAAGLAPRVAVASPSRGTWRE